MLAVCSSCLGCRCRHQLVRRDALADNFQAILVNDEATVIADVESIPSAVCCWLQLPSAGIALNKTVTTRGVTALANPTVRIPGSVFDLGHNPILPHARKSGKGGPDHVPQTAPRHRFLPRTRGPCGHQAVSEHPAQESATGRSFGPFSKRREAAGGWHSAPASGGSAEQRDGMKTCCGAAPSFRMPRNHCLTDAAGNYRLMPGGTRNVAGGMFAGLIGTMLSITSVSSSPFVFVVRLRLARFTPLKF
jgi:hypothetical protein